MVAKKETSERTALVERALRVTIETCARKGIDLRKAVLDWAQRVRVEVSAQGADVEFGQLLRCGCGAVGLAACVFVARIVDWVVAEGESVAGPKDQRARLQRDLLDVASRLESISRAAFIDESIWGPLTGGLESPNKTAAILRTYARAFDSFSVLMAYGNVRSTEDLQRYVFCRYVRLKTEDWHDKEVSAILQAVTGSELAETTLRMWRSRSFSRIANPAPFVVDQLVAIADFFDERHNKSQK
jgi:hypothetical protein